MASPNLSEIITTSIQWRSGKLADGVTKNNALLKRLSEKGNVKSASGGNVILQELEYQENSSFMYYSGSETLNVQASDVLTSAQFNWKQAAVAVIVSGLEELQNSGKQRIIDLVSSRIKNAEKTLQNNIAIGIYSDGTGSGGKQIEGLQLAVPDAPSSGTYGGINRGTYTWWRSVKYGAVADGGGALTATNIQGYMNALYVQIVRGTDVPDLIVADSAYWKFYLNSLQAIQRITSDKMAQAGFQSLKYMGSDVVLDGGYGGGCPANHMYFLNTDYLYFRTHPDRNFAPLSPDRYATNQDAVCKLIGWAGNVTASNCFLQGVLIA